VGRGFRARLRRNQQSFQRRSGGCIPIMSLLIVLRENGKQTRGWATSWKHSTHSRLRAGSGRRRLDAQAPVLCSVLRGEPLDSNRFSFGCGGGGLCRRPQYIERGFLAEVLRGPDNPRTGIQGRICAVTRSILSIIRSSRRRRPAWPGRLAAPTTPGGTGVAGLIFKTGQCFLQIELGRQYPRQWLHGLVRTP